MLVVDYLQLMQSTIQSRDANRVQEVSEITRGLKSLARELQVPVVALSQLSRQAEMRESKEPQLSDLRESGSIEQDADLVIFLWREKERGTEEATPTAKRQAQAGKAPQRPTGELALWFKRQTRFVSYAESGTLRRGIRLALLVGQQRPQRDRVRRPVRPRRRPRTGRPAVRPESVRLVGGQDNDPDAEPRLGPRSRPASGPSTASRGPRRSGHPR
jgi:hypothetical protein